KLDDDNFIMNSVYTYHDYSINYKLIKSKVIANWYIFYMNERKEELQEKAKGRPPMSKNHKPKPSKQETELSREELLERENELLRLENAYLKKLKAFQENPNAFLEKHKQRWRSNSKKKDSN